jgi:hypothetical protein
VSDLTPTVDLGHLEVERAETVKPKRRRWIGWVIALVVVVALLIAAWFIGDVIARDYAEKYVRSTVIEQFDLPADKKVDVEIGPGSLLAQALFGSIDSVDVAVDDITLGPVSGDVKVAMTGVPLAGDAPVKTLRVAVTVPEEKLAGLADSLSGASVDSVTLVDDTVALETEFMLFNFAVPVGVRLTPIVENGDVGFEPAAITVNGAELSVADLKDGPFGGLADSLLASQTFCVASSLPEALTITDVAVAGKNLIVKLEADGASLGGADFSRMGTCPPAAE